jgi:hypothetical protein
MLPAPLLNALDVHRAFEGIDVFRFFEPPSLRVDFAGVATRGLGTEALTAHMAGVGMENPLAVLTVRLWSGMCHGPVSPQAHDLKIAAWKKANGDLTARGRRRKKREEWE